MGRLSSDINWDDFAESDLHRVHGLLGSLKNPGALVAERASNVLVNSHLYESYAKHMEIPRPVMDKFILYIDPLDKFRVRLHKFKSGRENYGSQSRVHDHRWPFASLILTGTYVEKIYCEPDVDNGALQVPLRLLEENIFNPGDINLSLGSVPHLTVNPSETEACYTLFVRGKSDRPFSNIYDLESGEVIQSWGLKHELHLEIEKFRHLACD